MIKKNKKLRETLQWALQERTFPKYGKMIWYKSTRGKGKGYYAIIGSTIAAENFERIPINISKEEIEKKIIDENTIYSEEIKIDKSVLKNAINDHEKIIQTILAYAEEYNIKIYKNKYADILIEDMNNQISILEIKTTNKKNIKKQTRLAIAQLLDYSFRYEKIINNTKVNKFIIFSDGALNSHYYEFINKYVDGIYSYKNKKDILKNIFKIKNIRNAYNINMEK